MTSSLYEYDSESGQPYAVLIPDDFAIAMGSTPASPGTPYLPIEISPRILSFNAGLLTNRQAVATTREIFDSTPSPLIVGVQAWNIMNKINERVVSHIPASFLQPFFIAGAPGPQGPPGVVYAPTEITASAPITCPHGVSTTLLQSANLVPGSYLFWATSNGYNTQAGDDYAFFEVQDNFSTVYAEDVIQGAQFHWVTTTVVGILTFAATRKLELHITPNANDWLFENGAGNTNAAYRLGTWRYA